MVGADDPASRRCRSRDHSLGSSHGTTRDRARGTTERRSELSHNARPSRRCTYPRTPEPCTTFSGLDLRHIVASVKREAQWYLVEALSRARGHRGIRDGYEAKQAQLKHFAGVLAGFRYLGAVTQDEEQDWYSRMLLALGYELLAPPGASRAVYLSDPAKRPPVPQARNVPEFIRSQPGPDQEFEIHGGKLRVIAVEFYDSVVAIRWPDAGNGALPSPEPAAKGQIFLFSDVQKVQFGSKRWSVDGLSVKG